VGDIARTIERIAAAVSRVAQGLAAVACLLCLALVCYAVVARYLFGRAEPWTDEAVGWCVVALVMLAVPEAQRRGENIGVDWLVDKWTGARRRAVIGLGALSVALTALVLIREGWETVAFTRMIGIVSNQIPQVPLWAVQALIPLGAALLLLVAIAQIAAWCAGREPEDYEAGRFDAHE
jgi:TRAP-type C4-dicarboxylate transport system permease small subunit